MKVEEVAAYLRIPRPSESKLSQRGRIPCQNIGRHYRFYKGGIDQWLGNRSQNQVKIHQSDEFLYKE